LDGADDLRGKGREIGMGYTTLFARRDENYSTYSTMYPVWYSRESNVRKVSLSLLSKKMDWLAFPFAVIW
jgi:hypothetical protein